MRYSVCVCVCVCVYVCMWWLDSLFSSTGQWSHYHAGVSATTSRWNQPGEETRGKGRGHGFKSKNKPFFYGTKYLLFFLKRAAFSIFDVLLSSTWSARSLKRTRTKPRLDEALEVSSREKKKKKKCHNTLHSRLFAGSFCYAFLISRPAFPKVNTTTAKLLA